MSDDAPVPPVPHPPDKSPVQRVMEGIVDVVAILVVGLMAYTGKIPAWPAGVLVCLLAGVRLSDVMGAGNGRPPMGGMSAAIVGALAPTLAAVKTWLATRGHA